MVFALKCTCCNEIQVQSRHHSIQWNDSERRPPIAIIPLIRWHMENGPRIAIIPLTQWNKSERARKKSNFQTTNNKKKNQTVYRSKN